MTLLLKDPEAVLDYMVDWGAEYLADDALVRSIWDVSPDETDGVKVLESTFDHRTAIVQVAGGFPGKLYRVTNNVLTASGREDCRSITLRVEER